MKMLQAKLKLMLCVGLLFLGRDGQANIFKNMVKTAVDYMSGHVDKTVAYIDTIWFNVEQELYRPTEKAKVKLNAIVNNQYHLAMQYKDPNFPKSSKTKEQKRKIIKNILYLFETKKINFFDPKDELKYLKQGAYLTADQDADYQSLRAMIIEANDQVAGIKRVLEGILKKSYALVNKEPLLKESLLDVIKGQEGDSAFVWGQADEFKRFLWARLLPNDVEAFERILDPQKHKEAVSELLQEFAQQLASSKDQKSKDGIQVLINQVKHMAVLHQVFDMFVEINKMVQFLAIINDAIVDTRVSPNPVVIDILKKYHHNLNSYNKMNSLKKPIFKDQLVTFVVSEGIQPIHDLLYKEKRPVLVAKKIKNALVRGVLIDPKGKKPAVFANNNVYVEDAYKDMYNALYPELKKLKNLFKGLPYIGTDKVSLSGFKGKETVKDYVKKNRPTDYTVFATELAGAVVTQIYKDDTPAPLLEQYTTMIIDYIHFMCLYDVLEKIDNICRGRGGEQRLYSQLELDNSIQAAYEKAQKDILKFNNNDPVKQLNLGDPEPTLDDLLFNRGKTFDILKQRLNVGQQGPWDTASVIVKAGEDAYAAYLKMKDLAKGVTNLLPRSFYFDRTTATLEVHVQSAVRKVVNGRKGKKTELLEILDELNQAFAEYIDQDNLTNEVRAILKEMGSVYIKNIKEGLKAQVIAAWYVHDIAWKIKNLSDEGFLGTVSDTVRKITPTTGKVIKLELIY